MVDTTQRITGMEHVEDKNNGSVKQGGTVGFIKVPHREAKEVWDMGIVEPAPAGRKKQSDFTNIGTAFRTGPGLIEVTIKPGVSVSGTVVLRKR